MLHAGATSPVTLFFDFFIISDKKLSGEKLSGKNRNFPARIETFRRAPESFESFRHAPEAIDTFRRHRAAAALAACPRQR